MSTDSQKGREYLIKGFYTLHTMRSKEQSGHDALSLRKTGLEYFNSFSSSAIFCSISYQDRSSSGKMLFLGVFLHIAHGKLRPSSFPTSFLDRTSYYKSSPYVGANHFFQSHADQQTPVFEQHNHRSQYTENGKPVRSPLER